MKTYAFVISVCVLIHHNLSFAQQAYPPSNTQENTARTCRDHLDNDGNGWVDCADQDCQLFAFCGDLVAPIGDPRVSWGGDPEALWYLTRRLSPPPPPIGNGWARGAGITGFVLTGLSLLATVVSPTWGSRTLSAGHTIGFSQLTLTGAGVPIVAAGSGSARREGGVRASRGSRVASWVFYGLALLMNTGALVMQSGEATESGELYTDSMGWSALLVGGMMSVTSLLLCSIDAMVADRDANRRLELFASESVF